MEEVKKVRWSSTETDPIGSNNSPTAFSTLGAGGSTSTLSSSTLSPYTHFDFSFVSHYTAPESSNDDESESDLDLFPDNNDEDDDEDEDSEVDEDDAGQQVYYGPSSATISHQHGVHTNNTISPETAHERREWQQMLQSVLRGEVIKSEKKRLLNTDALQQKNSIQEIWLSLRALLRGRTMTDEIKFLEESRQSIDEVVDTIMQFKVNPDADDPALIQVAEVLKNVDRVESLYATRAEMIHAHPRYGSLPFQIRLDALNAWCTVTRSLHMQFKILRNWTGSDDLQISRHRLASSSSSSSSSSGPTSSYSPHHHRYQRTNSDSYSSSTQSNTIKSSDQLSLHTTSSSSNNSDTNGAGGGGGNQQNRDFSFVERILRVESALQDTFDKRTLSALNSLLVKSKQTMIANNTLFQEMNLPPFFDELQHLARFPALMVEEALNIRLETKDQIIDPPKQMVDAMLEDYRGLLALAYRVKRQYQELAHPGPGWALADDDDLTKKYDAVVMDAVRFYFRLMTWKLDVEKENNSLRECEVLEKEWEFLQSTVCRNTEATYYECTEQFCGLTIRQIQDVMTDLNAITKIDKQIDDGDVDLEARYTKLLHVMRMRARKILQFAKFFMGKLENASEYSFDPDSLDVLVRYLVMTGHFFVRTNTYEDERIYLIASPSLYNRPETISALTSSGFAAPTEGDLSTTPNFQSGSSLSHYFTTTTTTAAANANGNGNFDYDVQQQQQDYILFVAPWQNFYWPGDLMELDIPHVNIHLKPKRIRLVVSVASKNFKAIKSSFWASIKHAGLGVVREQRSHAPKVHKDMRRLKAAIYKLTETIMTSVYTIRDLTLTSGCHELVEECFSFASDFGVRVSKLFDPRHRIPLDLKLTQLAIQWICFITDDCIPTDRRTFRWAVAALEFGQGMTKGTTNILALGEADFSMLQSKVARCIALLISHFDVLGTRWTFEVVQQQKEELRKRGITARRNSYITSSASNNTTTANDHHPHHDISRNRNGGGGVSTRRSGHPETSKDVAGAELGNEAAVAAAHRYIRDAWMKDITQLESTRNKREQEAKIVGKVLDDQKPEDQSLVFLAPSSSNISFRWQQGRYIGAGTFGSVYMAINLDTSSIMAVKEIRFPDSSALSALHKAIKEEMNVMEMLSHRNIVQYFGMEVHRDKVNIFMEYCENGSLGSLLEAGGRIEAEYYIVDYAYQLLSGLAYLHDNNIVHRDIKPDNILIDHQGQLKLTDFGASKIIAHGQKTLGIATAKVANSLAGTPMYMSPEVITGGDTGRKGSMDIWSLGCCVVQMATGRRPWSTLDNEWSVMFHVVTGHPPLPDPSQLSSSGISFLKECFTRNPHERPTAHELLSHSWVTNYLEYGIIVDNEDDDNDNEEIDLPPPTPNITKDVAGMNDDELMGEIISMDQTTPTPTPLPSLPTPSTSATQLFYYRQQQKPGLEKYEMAMVDQIISNNMLHMGDKDVLDEQQEKLNALINNTESHSPTPKHTV